MMLKVFTVYDLKTEAYLTPLFYRSRGEFLRQFVEAVNDPQSNISKHPGDFIAYEIGEWEDNEGVLRMYDPVIGLGKALDYLKEEVDVTALGRSALRFGKPDQGDES